MQRFEPKYSLYFYKEFDNEDEEIKYLLLRIEIPGNIIRLTARSTDSKTERYYGILIKVIKERDEFPEKSNENLIEISDNRIYDEFSYFIAKSLYEFIHFSLCFFLPAFFFFL